MCRTVRVFVVTDEALSMFFSQGKAHLHERERRVLAGLAVRALGRGGIVAVAEATRMSRSTVQGAVAQVDEKMEVSNRARAPEGDELAGRSRDPGDPMCPLRWTTKSTEHLAQVLRDMGHVVSPDTVGRLLVAMDYCLQAPAKENEGAQQPDRDAQFRYLNEQVEAHLGTGEPVISVDVKKKEVVGNLATKGRKYEHKREPTPVDVDGFSDPELGKATSYQVLDLGANAGFVTIGSHGDTAELTVTSIGRGGTRWVRSPTPTPLDY